LGLFSKSKAESLTKCRECGSELHDPERLKRHQKIAHDKKNEKCRTCGNEFPDAEALRKHKKKCK
jgi:uncharacterized Zn-finger protein|tara:strand:- start:1752 stop:1946 length:195 start_codon:yes stop_codon:yes gene_type:complete